MYKYIFKVELLNKVSNTKETYVSTIRSVQLIDNYYSLHVGNLEIPFGIFKPTSISDNKKCLTFSRLLTFENEDDYYFFKTRLDSDNNWVSIEKEMQNELKYVSIW